MTSISSSSVSSASFITRLELLTSCFALRAIGCRSNDPRNPLNRHMPSTKQPTSRH